VACPGEHTERFKRVPLVGRLAQYFIPERDNGVGGDYHI
jgi:hypothetical protein